MVRLPETLKNKMTPMKNALLVFLLLPAVCRSQTANVFAETQNILSKNSYQPILKAQASYFPKEIFGFMAFSRFDPAWGEGIMSLVVSPNFTKLDAFSISAGIGIERAAMPARMMSTLFIKKSLYSSISVFEYGGSGWWYSHKSTFNVHKDDLKVAIFAERFTGLGPQLDFYENPLTFFIGPTYDIESKSWRANFGMSLFWSVTTNRAAL
jgi:hypothetical protein